MQEHIKPIEIIHTAKLKGINLFVQNDQLGLKKDKKVELSSELLVLIQENKNQLIDFLKRNQLLSSKQEKVDIKKVIEADSYPLSSAQYRLWLASQGEQGAIAYNVPNTIELNGTYDLNCFKKAIHAVIERHEILRTVFRMNDVGEVRQWVLNSKELGFSIDHKDFRDYPNPESDLKAYIAKDAHMPFDLVNGPLLRASLLQLTNDRYVLYYNMHHIISDGWSSEILSREVAQYYEAFKNSSYPVIAPLRIQYKDYATWQQAQLNTEIFKQHKAYWRTHFAEDIEPVDLPTNKKRPVFKTYNGRSIGTWLAPDITARLRDFVTERGGSLFMGLLATWKILLFRYSGNDNIVVGCPIEGRSHEDLENQIGCYINTLALRTQLNREESFAAFFDRFKDNMLNAYAHQDYPFDKLLEELNLAGQPGRSPLFDVLVDYHGVSQNAHPFNEEVAYEDLGPSMVKFDLEFDPTEVGGGVNLLFAYNSDVYELGMVSKLVGHYKRLIASLLLDPAQKVGQVSYLSKEETTELLEGYNSSRLDTRFEPTIVDLFADQVSRNPKGIAVRYKELSLSYETLDARSNQLAHYLKKKGVGKDTLVPICVESPLEMIQGILGIVKAGGAYVPIDPNCPEQRLEYILGDIKAEQLLTSTALVEKFEVYEDEMELKCLDEEEWLESNSKQALEEGPSPDQLVYVIYTSGTTGVPKGVLIEHRNLSDYLNGLWKKLGWEEGQSYGLMSTPTADLGNTVLFSALGRGGMLHTFSKEDLMNAHDLNDYFKKHSIDWIKIVPSHWQSLGVGEEILTPKKGIVFGGEVLSVEVIKQIKQNAPDLKVVNHYGPTETTIGKLMHQVDMNEEYEVVPIGLPFSNTAIYILDPNKKLLPKGAVGELYISGAGVARGYLNQEDLTAERFIENPYRAGEKMYGTGDLGKWLPSGEVGFKGRKDNQIKIRGYRVELEEIESVLNQLSNIEKSVVVAYEKEGGSKQLVAYVVSKELVDSKSIKEGLMLVLEEKLPDHMVPEIYVKLEKMPLTSNGKINRKALPVPDIFKQRENYVAPSTEQEKLLVSLWQEILKRDQISINDHFFQIGGDSIKSIQLIGYLRKKGYRLEVQDSIKFPVLKKMADVLHKEEDLTVITPNSIEKPNTLSEGYFDLDQVKVSGNQAYFVKRPNAVLLSNTIKITNFLESTFEQSLRKFITNYDSLSVKFSEGLEGERVIQQKVSSESLMIDIKFVDTFDADNIEALEIQAKKFLKRPFKYFERSALIRCFLVIDPNDSNKAFLRLGIAHGLFDIETFNTVCQDFETYFTKGNLPPKKRSNFHFSNWQQNFLDSLEGKNQRKWWSTYLDSISDNKKENGLCKESDLVKYTIQRTFLSGEVYKKILSIIEKLEVPMTALFLAAHQKLINQLNSNASGIQLIAVGGREETYHELPIDEIYGVTTNFLPFKIIEDKSYSPDEYLYELFGQYLNTRINQKIPFETIKNDYIAKKGESFEHAIKGYFNFRLEEKVYPGIDTNETGNVFISKDEIPGNQMYGLGLVCIVYQNQIELRLLCPEEWYHSNKQAYDIGKFVNDMIIYPYL